METIAKKHAKENKSHMFKIININSTMKSSQENGKFKIICIRVPKWLAFILKKFAKGKREE